MGQNCFKNKEFTLGANYWASHAGTMMWRDWKPEVVEEDMKKLSDCGVKVVRAFPLWSDFQPITKLLGGNGVVNEISHGERFLDLRNPAERAGVSQIMMDRFKAFCEIADKYTEIKTRKVISLKPVEDRFKEKIEKYMNQVTEVRLK